VHAAIVLLLMGVLLFGYLAGIRAGRPWGKPLTAAAGVCIALALTQSLLGVVFVAGLLAAYFAGVRRGHAWGVAVAGACIVGLVILAVHRPLTRRVPGQVRYAQQAAQRSMSEGEALGRALWGRVPRGARIFLLADMPFESRTGWRYRYPGWRAGLSRGLRDDTWQDAGYYGPATAEPLAISEAIERAEGPVHAVVSFAGLPGDLEELSIYGWGKPPAVAACFPGKPDLTVIRRWLQDGLLDAAAVRDGRALKVYTRDALP